MKMELNLEVGRKISVPAILNEPLMNCFKMNN